MRVGIAARHLKAALAITVASAASLFAVGVYLHFERAQPDTPVVSDLRLPSPADERSSPTLVIHESPKVVPEVYFVDDEGRDLSLADFRGKTILLNVWATWCVPCRREMPSLDRLRAKLGGSGFEVVPLSIDRGGVAKIKAFYTELGLKSLGIYVDASGNSAYRLGAVGIPATLLINPDGLEIGRLAGPTEWDSPENVGVIERAIASARTQGKSLGKAL